MVMTISTYGNANGLLNNVYTEIGDTVTVPIYPTFSLSELNVLVPRYMNEQFLQ